MTLKQALTFLVGNGMLDHEYYRFRQEVAEEITEEDPEWGLDYDDIPQVKQFLEASKVVQQYVKDSH